MGELKDKDIKSETKILENEGESYPLLWVPPFDAAWAAYVFVSMANKGAIDRNLKNFPLAPADGKYSDSKTEVKGEVSTRGVSTTLLWSGKKGCNIPVDLYRDENRGLGGIGFVLDPIQLDIPRADFFAENSGGKYHPSLEITKRGFVINNPELETSSEILKSNYPEKKGYKVYYGVALGGIATSFTTNHAKWNRRTNTYLEKGTAENFAEAVWRRYFKKYGGREITFLNEAVVWKIGNENPIKGLIIHIEQVTLQNVQEVLSILQENPRLKLYLYDEKAAEHIIKFRPNKEAIKLLTELKKITELNLLKEHLKIVQKTLHPITQDSNNLSIEQPNLRFFNQRRSAYVAGSALGTVVCALIAAEAVLQLMDNLQNTDHNLTGALENTANDILIAIAVLAGVIALVSLIMSIGKTRQDYHTEVSQQKLSC
jgi:predicted metal-dependent hydrolase